MKVAPTVSHGNRKKAPLLPLVPDPLDEMTHENSVSYQLRTKPGVATSDKYKKTVRVLDGSESIRTILRWANDSLQVCRGLGLADAPDKYEVILNLLCNSAHAVFKQKIDAATLAAFDAYVALGTNAADRLARRGEGRARHVTNDMLTQARRDLLSSMIPAKSVSMIKRYLRRECRKPPDMKIRQYYQHLVRINNDELPVLPPFDVEQNLKDDEMIDILCFSCPKSWAREMDRQGFDPLTKSVGEVVAFLEQIENAKEFDGQEVDHNQKASSDNNKKKKSSQSKGKYCMLHGKGNHSTDECNTLKEQTKKIKGGSSSGGNGNGGGNNKKFGNKTWTRKATDSTNSNKKELAAFIKKSVAEKVSKEMFAIEKKRKADDEEMVDGFAFDAKPAARKPAPPKRQVKFSNELAEMLSGDLKGFNYKDMDDLKIESDDEDGEVSC